MKALVATGVAIVLAKKNQPLASALCYGTIGASAWPPISPVSISTQRAVLSHLFRQQQAEGAATDVGSERRGHGADPRCTRITDWDANQRRIDQRSTRCRFSSSGFSDPITPPDPCRCCDRCCLSRSRFRSELRRRAEPPQRAAQLILSWSSLPPVSAGPHCRRLRPVAGRPLRSPAFPAHSSRSPSRTRSPRSPASSS